MLLSLSLRQLSTSGFVDEAIFSCHITNGPESSTASYFEEVHQVAVPVGCQRATVLGRVDQNAAPMAKSVIYDCVVCDWAV